jgi:hypothetical protein
MVPAVERRTTVFVLVLAGEEELPAKRALYETLPGFENSRKVEMTSYLVFSRSHDGFL